MRFQVPTMMQERLGKKEYWISLGTSDHVKALKIAVAVTQEKRIQVENVHRGLSDIRQTILNFTEEQVLALGTCHGLLRDIRLQLVQC